MENHYTLLDISPGAAPAEIKAAYHRQIKAFPAHQYPQEFKSIRAAYEALRQEAKNTDGDFLKIQPAPAALDPELLRNLRAKVDTETQVSLEELMRLTF
jgi:curved DNA-binding protein CbpA